MTEKTINRICRARLFVKPLAISPFHLLSFRLRLVNTVPTQAYTNSYLSVSSQRSDPVCTALYSLNAGLIPLFGQLEINLACIGDTPGCIQYFQ